MSEVSRHNYVSLFLFYEKREVPPGAVPELRALEASEMDVKMATVQGGEVTERVVDQLRRVCVCVGRMGSSRRNGEGRWELMLC